MDMLIQLHITGDDHMAVLVASKRLYQETGITLGEPRLTDEGVWIAEGVTQQTGFYRFVENNADDAR